MTKAEQLKKTLEKTAKESLQLEIIGETFYFYGSELACLRLLKLYRTAPNASCFYSKNLKTHVFCLD